MAKTAFYISTLSFSLALLGCGGGSGMITTNGQRCADQNNYNPLPLNAGPGQKVSVKAGDKQLTPGKYNYNGAELYYYDSSTKFQVHMFEGADKATGMKCVRGAPAGGAAFSDGKVAANTLTVAADGSVDFTVRNYMFTFDGRNVKLFFTDLDNSKASYKSVEDVFSAKGSQMQFYKVSETALEARSSELNGNIRKDLVVRYVLQK